MSQLYNLSPLATSLYNDIETFIDRRLKNFKDENIEKLKKKENIVSYLSILIPIILTFISLYITIVYDFAYFLLTNLASAILPVYKKSIDSQIETFNDGFKKRLKCRTQQRQVIIADITEDPLTKETFKKFVDFIIKLLKEIEDSIR